MQKLASLGYVGIQKSNTASAPLGIDPKDSIATANKVESALQAIDDGKPEKALPILQQVLRILRASTWRNTVWVGSCPVATMPKGNRASAESD